jgi:hypothetical protein
MVGSVQYNHDASHKFTIVTGYRFLQFFVPGVFPTSKNMTNEEDYD